MPSIRRRKGRSDEERERLAMVARALMEAEPAEVCRVTISLHLAGIGDQLPRIPVVGMEAGAIRGTKPHVAGIRRVR